MLASLEIILEMNPISVLLEKLISYLMKGFE
jgi:hypothetical protein